MNEREARLHAAFREVTAPIRGLLERPDVTDIMLTAPVDGGTRGELYICVNTPSPDTHEDYIATGLYLEGSDAMRMLTRFAAAVSAPFNEAHPELSCWSPYDGFRIEGAIPPKSSAPTFSLRLHRRQRRRTLHDYVKAGTLTEYHAAFLTRAAQEGRRIVVGGAMRSGKTTLLNVLLEVMAARQRVLTIEDALELQRPNALCEQWYVDNDKGRTFGAAIKRALRTNASRIVVGEIRDGQAALAAIKAWTTGHPGMATTHAGSCEEVLQWLYDLSLEVSDTVRPARIARGVELIVHCDRTVHSRSITIASSEGWDEKEQRFRVRVLEP